MEFTPRYNPDAYARKQKGLTKMFAGDAPPFYTPGEVMPEGAPVKFGTEIGELLICPVAEGATKCVGLAMQDVYNDSIGGQMSQLENYHFANDTAQRLDGQPIGLLTGCGWASTTNYIGTVGWGDQVYVGASGKLSGAGDADSKIPARFEGSLEDGSDATAPTPARIRFNFNPAI
jgi:hypothetical protein